MGANWQIEPLHIAGFREAAPLSEATGSMRARVVSRTRRGEEALRYEHNWGFGMAPPKAETQDLRVVAVRSVLELLATGGVEDPTRLADQLSEVKGLFTESVKQDQWDWFTVWSQLGRPSRSVAHRVSQRLGELARAVRMGEPVERIVEDARSSGAVRHLRFFLEGPPPLPPDVGFVYVLSTREQPNLLKIGFTNRTVEERVKEINGDTGVAVPFGVRGVWTVRGASSLERQIHQRFAAYRVRDSREFFELPFEEASREILDVIREVEEA